MNIITWFEIPVVGFNRAKTFYESVLDISIHVHEVNGALMGVLGDATRGISGAIIKHEWYKPSEHGVLLYLNAGEDVMPALARAEAAGGTVVIPKTKVSEDFGYMAVFRDPDGNRIALRSTG